ncbi:MAG: DUF2384 domain-containing protein [Thermomicrobiales bacterium]|nr:DUF2384 domain-containing protein [Thermomicrobiales bacterium]
MSSPLNTDPDLARLHQRAAEVLGDAETARQWMNAPQFGLAAATPRSLLATHEGRARVHALLEGLEPGFLA